MPLSTAGSSYPRAGLFENVTGLAVVELGSQQSPPVIATVLLPFHAKCQRSSVQPGVLSTKQAQARGALCLNGAAVRHSRCFLVTRPSCPKGHLELRESLLASVSPLTLRLYIVFARSDLDGELAVEKVHSRLAAAIDRLGSDYGPVPLNDLLLPESSNILVSSCR